MKTSILVFVIFFLILPAFAFADSFEPDNSVANASTISTNGTCQAHEFDSGGDFDFVKFSANAGDFYLVETMNLSSSNITDTNIFLYDSAGSAILSSDKSSLVGGLWSARIVWRPLSTGTYYIKINETNEMEGGVYNICVEKQGTLSPYLVYPSSWLNVTINSVFNFTAGITCIGGPCSGVKAILDPEQQEQENSTYDFQKLDPAVASELGDDEVAVIIKLKDWPVESLSMDDINDFKKSKKARSLFIQKYRQSEDVQKRELRQKIKQQIIENQDSVLGTLDVVEVNRSEERIKNRKAKSALLSSDVDFKLNHRYENVNSISGIVTKKGLDKLLENPAVEYVSLDRKVQASLSVSVPRINADDVWLMSVDGRAIDGSGQTVCIIDTGINYNHADFGSLSGFPNSKVVGGYDFVNDDNNPADDHSHGSHCAGIAASEDSTYKGVAPGASLVAIKALDSSGSGDLSDVVAGIDWCVSNSEALNISVISMSLGTWYVYDNNGFGCEDFEPTMTSAINTAFDNNIFVAAAAGNRYTSGDVGISVPACIKNATSVGITNNLDSMIGYGQRSFTLDLLAPGSGITATNYLGGHMSKSGTSMSTPHVAGAAALVQQYFRQMYNRTLNPKEVEWILKFNGVDVYDGVTDLVFSRVNAFDAVNAKGAVSTTVGARPFYTTESNPRTSSCLSNMANNTSCNVSWLVNATGTIGENYTFFVIFENDYMTNITGRINISVTNTPPEISFSDVEPKTGTTTDVFNFTANYSDTDNHPPSFIYLVIGNAGYSMLAEDMSDSIYSDGKMYYYEKRFSHGNYSFYFNASDGFNTTSTEVVYAPNVTDILPPAVSIIFPDDNYNSSSSLQYFGFNVTEESSASINCSLVFDGSVANYTVLSGNASFNMTYEIPVEGSWLWNISCSDGKNINTSLARSITYDSTPPSVALSYPDADASLSQNISVFSFAASDDSFAFLSCYLYIDDGLVASNSSVSNSTSTDFAAVELSPGVVSWFVGCSDPAGNNANSSSRNVVVPKENKTAFVNTTANTWFSIDAGSDVGINISTTQSTTGTLEIVQYISNPKNISATSANGFAELIISKFISIEPSGNIEGNLSWYLLNLYYSDSDLPSNIDESTLRIYYFNETSALWVKEPNSGVDSSNNWVWANITHFSTFSIGGDEKVSSQIPGGGGGGGGGGSTSSLSALTVNPSYSASAVEVSKNQQIDVVYEGGNYHFKVDSFTSSIMILKDLSDSSSLTVSNGMTTNMDLDKDGRFDVQLVYSGKISQKGILVFYLSKKPEQIPLLPPSPRKTGGIESEEQQQNAADIAQESFQSDSGAEKEEVFTEPEQQTSILSSLSRYRKLIIYLSSVILLYAVVFLLMHIITGRKPPVLGGVEIRRSVKK